MRSKQQEDKMSSSLIEKLEGYLSLQKENYEQYLVLADDQKRALINSDIEALNKLNVEVDKISIRISEIEKARLDLMEELSGIAGEKIKKLDDLFKYFQHERENEIRTLAKTLKDALLDTQRMNIVNTGLIQQQRKYVQSTMAIVTGVANRKKSDNFKTYGKNGVASKAKQQVRSLVNKEG